MFVLGVLPALFVLWIRSGIPESEPWERTDESRKLARARAQSGASLGAEDEALTRFTHYTSCSSITPKAAPCRHCGLPDVVDHHARLKWGISHLGHPALYRLGRPPRPSLSAQQWASYAGMTYNFGAVLGYASFGFLADRFGRKGVTLAYFAIAWALTPVLFLWTQDLTLLLLVAAINGYFSLGQYSWMPVWLPELFPTRIRATAMAFTFNAPRFIAFLGPLSAGCTGRGSRRLRSRRAVSRGLDLRARRLAAAAISAGDQRQAVATALTRDSPCPGLGPEPVPNPEPGTFPAFAGKSGELD